MRFGFTKGIVPAVAVVTSMFFVISAQAQDASNGLTGAQRNALGKQVLSAKKPEEAKAKSGKFSIKSKSAAMMTSGSRSEAEQTITNALNFKTVYIPTKGDTIEYTHLSGKITGCKMVVTESMKLTSNPNRLFLRYTLDFADISGLDVSQPGNEAFALHMSTGSKMMQEISGYSDFRSTERDVLENPIFFTRTLAELEAVGMAVATMVNSCR